MKNIYIDYQVDFLNIYITAKEHKNLSETLVDSRESQWSGTNWFQYQGKVRGGLP